MTGRERLQAVLHKQPTDRLPWTTLVDDATLSQFPRELQGQGGIDFYHYLGCDILLLNGWNTPYRFRSPECVWGRDVETVERQEGRRTIRETKTPKGTLTAVFEKGHPVKYPVDSLEAVRIYHDMWERATFVDHDDRSVHADLERLIGVDGVVTRFWGPSTIPRLLELDMGIEGFYYLLHDHPDLVSSLIGTMHEREVVAFQHLARGPWDSVTLVENTSTFYISPKIYAEYNMPHQREFVEIMRENGKVAIIHMCGHVRNLLHLIRETGCDGIHFLTPPPTGDTPWEEALDVIGEDLIIFGTLDPSIFVSGPVEDIGPCLDRLMTPRLREANFVVSPTADGIVVGLERFVAVKGWVEENG